ncbi:MAG TPA: CPBP family intramembrane glutamic endopeptidase [Planctomycetota bacterium]|nr:CPBP family intramembrane glutamic endopeptidase [Planctomycetota bacterium]
MGSDPPVPPDLPAPDPPLPFEEAPPGPPPCPKCLSPVKPGANFCPACGEPLLEGLPRAPRRSVALHIQSDIRRSTLPIRRTMVFYLLWLGILVVTSILRSTGFIDVHAMFVGDTMTSVVTVAWLLIFRRDALRLYALPARAGFWFLVPILAAWPIAAAINLFASLIERMIGIDFKYTPMFFDHGFGWGWVILIICVQPAVIEELAFRGIIQTTLQEVMGTVEAVIVTAVAFSIMHWNLAILVPFILIGSYFGWLRQRSGSLFPAMVAHFLHNLLVVLSERWPILPG